jgi:tetratricopeptide (TPR) repeat protein
MGWPRMRQRPIEFWWIALFSLFQGALAFNHFSSGVPSVDPSAFNILHGVFVASAALLLCFNPLGRKLCALCLGLHVCNESVLLLGGQPLQDKSAHVVFWAFCLWMFCYLHSFSTQRLCSRSDNGKAARASLHPAAVLDGLGVLPGLGAFFVSWLAGGSLPQAGSMGLIACVACEVFLSGKARRVWAAMFAPCEPGYPQADAAHWRAACRAMSRREFQAARLRIRNTSVEARSHPASALLLALLDWHELLALPPANGELGLRRAAFDYDWKPGQVERNRIADYIDCAGADAFRELADERAGLIDALVRAGLSRNSFFSRQNGRVLERITGETFAFNARESWSAWWRDARPHWSGDAGPVCLAVRLLRMDAIHAAHALAQRVAGRAEEPILKEVTGQVLFLNTMQKALKEHEGVENFIKQPQRMLLVPELTDAVGLLHADSQLLENLGMPLKSVARRLHQRVPVIDYIERLWRRYPGELSSDMPWVLKTLCDKNLGVLRAHSKFKAWWPLARDSFMRHDHAVSAGLLAYAEGDLTKAEGCFREALKHQPRELSSRYNLARCLMRRHACDEAARLLRELTQMEPKESYWWLVLGEMHRDVNRASDAHAAFRRALELGAAAPRVAYHRALTFAREHRESDAIKQLDRVLGANPTASKIDALVSALEGEGLWKLAVHYREESFRRGLDPSGSSGDDKDERDSADDVTAW